MYSNTSGTLGQDNLGAMSTKACFKVANSRRQKKGLVWRLYHANIWPHPCFPRDKDKRMPLFESDEIHCQIIDAIRRGLPHPCFPKDDESRKSATSDKTGGNGGGKPKPKPGEPGGSGVPPKKSLPSMVVGGKRPGLFIQDDKDRGPARKPATAPRKVDAVFTYGGGAPQEIERETQQRLKLASQGFISREAQPVKKVEGAGFISKR